VEANALTSQAKTRQRSLESFFKFVNFQLPKSDESLSTPTKQSEFMGLIHLYTTFLCQHESKYPFLKFGDKLEDYAGDLLKQPSVEAFLEKRDFFAKLQSHLRSKLQTTIGMAESNESAQREPFIEMKGTLALSVDSEADSFVEAFRPDRIKSKGGLNLVTEKALADLVFLDMVRDGGLKPSRFGACKRCNNFFYRARTMRQRYCSVRCGNAVRQLDWRGKEDKRRPKAKAKKPA